jgi:1-aminocyclopropane-1-carboxylate deaminase/D-cysteine desulfhydrase-like pyridoxal-dependent ACC family enzyme
VGPAFGGNKSRQLEYLLGDALASGSDCIVHGGALQSNYCRQLAAACGMLGIDCFLLLSDHYKQRSDQGSHLITKLLGANISLFPGPLGLAHEAEKAKFFSRLQESGRNPYLITYPRSEVLGSLSYLNATIELIRQLPVDQFPERIVMPAVGASYIGVLLALHLLGLAQGSRSGDGHQGRVEIIGVPPLRDEYEIEKAVRDSMREVLSLLEFDPSFASAIQIDLNYSQVGPGYAKPTAESLEALTQFARHEGVMLDPVYTSKAAAHLKSLPADGKRTVFWHTGGSPAIFAYGPELLSHLESQSSP